MFGICVIVACSVLSNAAAVVVRESMSFSATLI